MKPKPRAPDKIELVEILRDGRYLFRKPPGVYFALTSKQIEDILDIWDPTPLTSA